MQIATMASTATMSSREIAVLTERRHDNVFTVCRGLKDSGVCPEIQDTPYTNQQNGQTYTEFRLSKRDCLILVARLSPEFTARIVDRWQELEAEQTPVIPKTYAQALMLAALQAEQLEQQQAKIEAQRPAVEFVERYTVADSGSKGFRETCKILKANEATFRAWLIEGKILYRLGGHLTAHQNHIDAGRFEVTTGEAGGHVFTSCKFTPKGVAWIAGEWAKHCLKVS